MANEIEQINITSPKERKRLGKILAAKRDLPDLTSLINKLLQDAIDKEFSPEIQKMLLSDAPEAQAEDVPIAKLGKQNRR